MNEEITFGGWLKQRRKELGITQEEFADSIDCALTTLQKIEGGGRRPSVQIAQLLADLLNIPSDEREAFIMFARAGRAAPVTSQAGSDASVTRAPWRAISSYFTNLPVVLTALIGREQEMEAAHNHLLGPQKRLLSLTGAPGVGKTRLALQVASDLAEHFEDGVFFVDLAPLVDPDLVLRKVARTLGLKDEGDLPAESLLLDYVRNRKLLLVLDNFEQVLDAANALVKLMHASPWLKVLVTSREALHVRGERRVSVSPLAVPAPSVHMNKESELSSDGSLPPAALAALAAYPSVELFIERAQAVSPEFELTRENARDVAAICTALEGLPLAIELTAARAGHLSPAEMNAALVSSHNMPFMEGRDAPARQRTLKSAFEWSYGLLGPTEQKLFRGLSVFAHGCSLQAAESVCNAAANLGTSISEALLSLVEKSLIIRLHKEGASRYTMLETIREYAFNELEANQEEHCTRRLHALYYVDHVHEAESHMAGPEQTGWLNKLTTDHDNVRAALGWLLHYGTGDAALVSLALQMSADMARFWILRGYLTEGREWLGTTLRNMEPLIGWADAEQVSVHVRALDMAGRLALTQGDYPMARKLWESGLALNQALGDKQRSGHLLNGLAQLALDRLSYEEAISLFQEGLNLAHEVDDKPLIARLLNNMANVYRNMMDYVVARQCYEDSLSLLRELGDKTNMVGPLNNLGLVAMDMEDYPAARRYLEESLHLCRELDQKQSLAFSLAFVGQLEARESDYDRAAPAYSEAISLAHELGSRMVLANCFEWVASMQARLGHPLEAAWLWGQGAALREAMNLPLPLPGHVRYERDMASARTQINPSAFEATWAEGRTATVEEGVKYAQEVLSLHYS